MSFSDPFNLASGDFLAVVFQSLSSGQLSGTPWTAAPQGSAVLHYLPEFAETRVH